ncbi:MAG TPA: YaiI/YqxD family protein [Lysobacter sp.]
MWVDADACPGPVRDIVVRAANRAQVQAVFVANQWIRLPTSPWLRAVQVAQGPDEADDAIASQLAAGDLVVTQDIPLAARAIEAGAAAMDPRGEVHTRDTIAQRLSMRNFMDELRGAGVQTGGPAAFHARDRQAFAAGLDRWLARAKR